MQPLLDVLSKQSIELYAPHQQLSVNESMIGTNCHLSFIQYMPKKPIKWGIKVWVCADGVMGYIYTFSVYCGANSSQPSLPKGWACGVVMKLSEPCLRKGCTVNMDYFYSSPELLKDLLFMNSSTLHSNQRQFPESLKAKAGEPAKPRGTANFACQAYCSTLVWQ